MPISSSLRFICSLSLLIKTIDYPDHSFSYSEMQRPSSRPKKPQATQRFQLIPLFIRQNLKSILIMICSAAVVIIMGLNGQRSDQAGLAPEPAFQKTSNSSTQPVLTTTRNQSGSAQAPALTFDKMSPPSQPKVIPSPQSIPVYPVQKPVSAPETVPNYSAQTKPYHFPYQEADPSRLVNAGTFVRGTYERSEQLDQDAFQAFETMRLAAGRQEIELMIISGFRNISDQAVLFEKQIARRGNESEAAKISYPAGDHSATRSGVAGKHDSKWGATPLMRHDPGYAPSIYNPSVRTFYAPTKINTTNTNVCGNVAFSVASFTGGNYSWSKSPNIILNTTSGSSVVATNSGNGTGWIEVVISSPCSGTSVTSRINLSVGSPAPTGIDGFTDTGLWRIKASANPVPGVGVTSYNWYKNGVMHSQHGEFVTIPITRGNCSASYDIQVESINACGVSSRTARNFDAQCNQRTSLVVYPNPTANQFAVESTDTTGRLVPSTFEATLLDKHSRVRKTGRTQTGHVDMNTSDLPAGIYFLEAKQGNAVERKQVLIQK